MVSLYVYIHTRIDVRIFSYTRQRNTSIELDYPITFVHFLLLAHYHIHVHALVSDIRCCTDNNRISLTQCQMRLIFIWFIRKHRHIQVRIIYENNNRLVNLSTHICQQLRSISIVRKAFMSRPMPRLDRRKASAYNLIIILRRNDHLFPIIPT